MQGHSAMTKDRQIVLMLILRKRLAKRLWLKCNAGKQFEDHLYAQYTEAANAAELARRILYGYEL